MQGFRQFMETVERFKYPRTPHLPWSPGATSDDKMLTSTEHLAGKEVVVTEKLDGENTNMYSDYIHARSVDSKAHPSRYWVRQLHDQVKQDIPPGWRISGENMFAKHSIQYQNLGSYFYVFAIFNEHNFCLSWDDTKEWCGLLNLKTVPELWRGIWNEKAIQELWKGTSVFGGTGEGYVVRTTAGFPYNAFANHIAKFVRPHHVQTDKHWMSQPVTKNLLKPE